MKKHIIRDIRTRTNDENHYHYSILCIFFDSGFM